MCDKKPANLTITVPEKVYTTIDAQTLAKMMANGEDVSIVDVRDEDFVGGTFDSKAEQLAEQLGNKMVVVFLCMYSQQRGPASAMLFNDKLTGEHKPKLLVLSGGFFEFLKLYKESEQFIEKFDDKSWKESEVGLVHVLDIPPFASN